MSSLNSVLLEKSLRVVQEQSQEIQTIMEYIGQGICIFGEDLKLGDTFSQSFSKMFQILEDGDIDRILIQPSDLSSAKKDQMKVALDMSFGSSALNFLVNAHALPEEMVIEQNVYEVDWVAIENDSDEVDKIMLAIRDVTEIRALQKESDKFQREMKIINQLVNVPPLVFNRFFQKSTKYLKRSKDLLKSYEVSTESLGEIKRYLHTLKGDSAMLHLSQLSEAVHDSETAFIAVGSDGGAPISTADLNSIFAEMELVFREYEMMNDNKLNRKFYDNSTKQRSVVEQIKRTQKLGYVRDIPKDIRETMFGISNSLLKSSFETLQEVLDDYSEAVISLCEELGKPTPIIDIRIDRDLVLDPFCTEELKVSLTHMTRNTVDHGFDSSPNKGLLKIEVKSDQDFVTILYDDHGRGFDLNTLRKKSEKVGYSWETIDQLCMIIFLSGLSTKENVTKISGRGVGMDAVKRSIESLGGSIVFEFKEQVHEDLDRISFRWIIKLPSDYISVKEQHIQDLAS